MTELTRGPDPRTLHLGPWGLTGAVPPDFSRQLLQAEMDWMQCGELVPEAVRSQFEKLKSTYLDGLFRYEHFTTVVFEGVLVRDGKVAEATFREPFDLLFSPRRFEYGDLAGERGFEPQAG
jgi:hypothetical protein